MDDENGRRLSKAFVVAEIALAFTLLTTSAVLVVHLRNLVQVSMGFDPDDVVAFGLTLPRRTLDPRLSGEARLAERMRLDGQRWAQQARVMDVLRQTPGVTGVSFATQLPGMGCAGRPSREKLAPPQSGHASYSSHLTFFRPCGFRSGKAGC